MNLINHKHLVINSIIMVFLLNFVCIRYIFAAQPDWINNPQKTKDYFYAVGYTEDVGAFEEIKEKAIQDAKGKIANAIFEETSVEKVFSSSGGLSDNEELRKSYSENVKSRSVVNLTGVETEDVYKEETKDSGLTVLKVWVLVKISNKNLERERSRILFEIQRRLALIDDNLKQADAFIEDGKVIDAVNSYVSAAVSSTRVKDRIDEFPIYINKADKVLEKIFLEAVGNPGEIDTGKGGNFAFKVFYSSDKGKMPVSNAKISFIIRNNDGDYTKTAVSGDDGSVSCRISALKEVKRGIRLYAGLNLDFPEILDLGGDYKKYYSTMKDYSDKISAYSEFNTESAVNRNIPTAVVAILKTDSGLKQLPSLGSEAQSYLIGKGYKTVRFPESISLSDIFEAKQGALDKLSSNGIKRVFVLYINSSNAPKYDNTLERYLGIYSVSAQLFDTSTGEILSAKNIKISATSPAEDGVFDSFIKAAGVQIKKLLE